MSRVKIEGVKELQDKLADPNLIGVPLKDMFDASTAIGKGAMIGAIGRNSGKPLAWQSILAKVEPKRAMVYSVMAREVGNSIDKGRKPGTPANKLAWIDYDSKPLQWVGPIARWAKYEGVREFGVGMGSPVPMIAKAISTAGTKGKNFIKTAKDQIKESLPFLLDKMARAIEGRAKR